MARTPIGGFLGGLSALSAVDLAVIAGRAALERAGVAPENIDEVTAGMVYKAGAKGNPARQVQLALDIPVTTPAATIEQQCVSGMRALDMAVDKLRLGKTQAALVCAMESMSNVPHLLLGARQGFRMGASQVEDSLFYDALHDAFLDVHMGITAENIAEKYGLSRQDQDQIALLSHQRAAWAQSQGWFDEEIVPVEIKTRKGPVIVDRDEHPRDTSLEQLGKLRAAFKKDGTVTSGNASGINDGACAVVVMTAARAAELGLKPLVKIRSIVSVGCEPELMGMGPIYAVPLAIEEAGLTKEDIEYYELNEAFAVQALACIRELGLNLEEVNGCGSGIALGHPVGMTALRLLVTGYHEMKRRGATLGCATLCAGGGPGMAMVFERLE